MKKVKKSQSINHLLTKIEHNLDKFHQKTIIIGVSGGADSLCLLNILHRKEIKAVAVYVNHGLRKEAVEDGLHVQALCRQWNIPFRSAIINVQDFSQDMKIPIEEASRILRYRKLFEIAEAEKADAVAVAHHADDQVETVLMHIIRGTGLSGLRGMPEITHQHNWHSSIPLIRPLLSLWKEDIVAYCTQNDIPAILDETNLDTKFFRNRLRHVLIPELESYNPNFKEGLFRMSGILQDDYALLSCLLEETSERLKITYLASQVTFSKSTFLDLHVSMQRMVLREVIAYLSPDLRDVDFAAVERANQLIISDNTGKQIDLVDNLILFLDGDFVVIKQKDSRYLRNEIPLMLDSERINVDPGAKITLSSNWVFMIESLTQPPEAYSEEENMYSVFVDADKCGKRLFLKTITAGDRFTPCGLDGHTQKVSDVFTNLKVSRWIRNLYPLVCNENEILWIPGHRISEYCKIDQETTNYFRISFYQEE